MVAPEEIKRVDFLYGPFSAAYPGNSMGGVLHVHHADAGQVRERPSSRSESFQTFRFYNTKDTYRTDQTSASVGNRWGDVSAFVSFNYQNSYSQPLGLDQPRPRRRPAPPARSAQLTRTGGPANVLGAGGLLHTEQAQR